MNKIKITINGKICEADAGESILKIAKDNGIEIPALCDNPIVKAYGACGMCVVEAKNSPKLMRACATIAADGMEIQTESERVKQVRKVALELLMSDHDGDCKGPCSLNCPAGTMCQEYVKQIALGKYDEALKIIKEKIPLPASIGRVCPHPCEKACRRNMVEEPISIAQLKIFAADKDLKASAHYVPTMEKDTGKKVGIIGGGPAGLSAAYYLKLKGHSVTIYDAMPKMGGMLRYGIPEYRLPKRILDSEIKMIENLGVTMINNCKMTVAEIKDKFDAVIVAIGAWCSAPMGTPGEQLKGVIGGIDFLGKVALGEKVDIGKNVAIVGGGNTAMDACRTAVRLGAENVYVIYRRTEAEMPAEKGEISEAKEEGVKFLFLRNPSEILGTDGRADKMKLQCMELGQPGPDGRRSPVAVEGKFEYLDVDTVIGAIGQKIRIDGFETLERNKKGNIIADEKTFRTSEDGVFAIGDATNRGASIAVSAIGEADKCVEIVHGYLNGMDVCYRKPFVSERQVNEEMYTDYEHKQRINMSVRIAEERKNDFKEVICGYTDEQAEKEASRCLECGCHDYHECKLIKYSNRYDINPDRVAGEKHMSYKDNELVTIERNQGKCILCGLCVRVCDEDVKKGILGLVGRGFKTVIKPEFSGNDVIDYCKYCHKCADACPTGALRIINNK